MATGLLGEFLELDQMRLLAGEQHLNMRRLALNLSGFVNGVARRHAETTQRMFPGDRIRGITNGVHPATWAHPAMAQLFDEVAPGWRHAPDELVNADQISSDALWTAHEAAKADLITLVAEQTGQAMRPDLPIVAYARRMTGYKRPALISSDVERLRSIARDHPFQLAMAGKAHPRDWASRDLIDRIVAENGGVLHDPETGGLRMLAPPPAFVEMLMRHGVEPISVGHTIVATWVPHEAAVLAAVEEIQQELRIIFNKGAIMILPSGVDKATGLAAALRDLGLSPLNVAGVGDAENDGAFLAACGLSAAVANALDAVKARCDLVLEADHGAGVVELVERVVDEDLALADPARTGLLLRTSRAGDEVHLPPGSTLLVAGGSGTGKSSFAIWLTEWMVMRGAESRVIDPEGDYEALAGAVAVGGDGPLPSDEDILHLLERTGLNLVLGVHGADPQDRRDRVRRLLPRLAELRGRTGRPHWLIIDEAHQFCRAMGMKSCRTWPVRCW